MRNLTVFILSAFMTFVLGINILSSKGQEFYMPIAPSVTVNISISPAQPTTKDIITFKVIASGARGKGIGRIYIEVNNRKVKGCLSSPCVYRGGPYPEGLLSYVVTVYDRGGFFGGDAPPWISEHKIEVRKPASLPKKEGGVTHLIPLAEHPNTQWSNGMIALSFPGDDGDYSGFANNRYSSFLENGRVYREVLLTHPDWRNNLGLIVGIFKIENLAENAIFKAEVGFLKEAYQSDGVEFRVFVNKDLTYYATKQCFYDGHLDELSFNLAKYAGQNVELVLQVKGLRTSTQDWAVWVDPRIEWKESTSPSP